MPFMMMPSLPYFLAQRAGQADQAELRHAVGADDVHAGGVRGDVEYVALLMAREEIIDHVAHHEERALAVHVHQRVPFILGDVPRLVAAAGERVRTQRRGVDQPVQPAHERGGFVQLFRDAACVRNVPFEYVQFFGGDGFGCPFQFIGGAPGDNHMSARVDQALRDGRAYAAAAAGHDDFVTAQFHAGTVLSQSLWCVRRMMSSCMDSSSSVNVPEKPLTRTRKWPYCSGCSRAASSSSRET